MLYLAKPIKLLPSDLHQCFFTVIAWLHAFLTQADEWLILNPLEICADENGVWNLQLWSTDVDKIEDRCSTSSSMFININVKCWSTIIDVDVERRSMIIDDDVERRSMIINADIEHRWWVDDRWPMSMSTWERGYQHLLVSFPDQSRNETDQWHVAMLRGAMDQLEKLQQAIDLLSITSSDSSQSSASFAQLGRSCHPPQNPLSWTRRGMTHIL